jgi:hypothetical protein
VGKGIIMVLRRWFAHTCVQLRRRKGIHKRYSSTDFSQYSSDETCLADALPIEISLTRYEMRPDCKQRGADGPTSCPRFPIVPRTQHDPSGAIGERIIRAFPGCLWLVNSCCTVAVVVIVILRLPTSDSPASSDILDISRARARDGR